MTCAARKRVPAPGAATGPALCVPVASEATPSRCRHAPNELAARLLMRLQASSGEVVTHAELVSQAYGDRADGGPLYALNTISRTIQHLRDAGFSIRNVHGRGYRLERAYIGQAGA